MKKTVITILILLTALFCAFAETNVTVQLKLSKQSKYVYGITSTKLEESTAQMDLQNVKAVEMERAANSEKIQMVADKTYYVSYMFYEYDNVDLKISTDGNLKNKDGQEVPFSVSVAAGYDNVVTSINKNATKTETKAVSFNSNDENPEGTIVSYTKGTDVIGDYVFASLPLTVGAVGENDLRGKLNTEYSANIVLTVVSNS